MSWLDSYDNDPRFKIYIVRGVKREEWSTDRTVARWVPAVTVDALELSMMGPFLAMMAQELVRRFDDEDWSQREWTCHIHSTFPRLAYDVYDGCSDEDEAMGVLTDELLTVDGPYA